MTLSNIQVLCLAETVPRLFSNSMLSDKSYVIQVIEAIQKLISIEL